MLDRERPRPRGLAAVAGVVGLVLLGFGVAQVPATAPTRPAAAAALIGAGPGSALPAADMSPLPRGQISAAAPPAATRRARPAPVRVPLHGPGRYVQARWSGDAAGRRGRLIRVDVRVERNLRLDADDVARTVQTVLNDRRSWRGTGRWRFRVVGHGSGADLHVYVATPRTTDRLCAPLLTRGKVSCQNGSKVVLNARRWVRGAASYRGHVADYRRYLVNHEVGHALGFNHRGCPGKARRAPVMMQQTKGLGACRRNSWPSPGRS